MEKQQERATRPTRSIFGTAILCVCLSGAHELAGQASQAKNGNSTKSSSAPNATNSTRSGSSGKIATQESPFYCSIEKTLTKAEREHKKELSMKMAKAHVGTTELADGYAFRFSPEVLSLSELADWVTTESRCCPFFDLELGVEREGGPLWLRVKGREGVKQFIRGEFKLLKVQ